ncbi:hypothetical protein AYO42_02020 [Rhizomicrobium sp. SCGC AG-212-E05]|nr:hypothetical protein AYO42_02020 [Rhizomicrobium sp. SCGC AG-212-E05]
MFEKLQAVRLSDSLMIQLEYDNTLPSGSLRIPEGASLNSKYTFLRRPDSAITEFGSYYAALYMSGMFCRYFPDIWMKHLATHSELSIIVEQVCDEAIYRLPLLALAELDQIAYLLPE